MAQTDYYLTLSNGSTTIDLTAYVARLEPALNRRGIRTLDALDGTEYVFPAPFKRTLNVTFKPMSGATLLRLYSFLTAYPSVMWYTVTYRDPSYSESNTHAVTMRITNDQQLRYLLKSVDSNRYYGGLKLEFKEQ